jgi:TonB family protein
MFEHAMLTGGAKGKRVWTTCAGVTGQLVLVAGMAVAPMVWPEAMPPAVFTMLAPMAPRGPAAKPNPEPKPVAQAAPIRKKKYDPTAGLVQPPAVPATIRIVKDPDEAEDRGPGPRWIGIPGGDPNGSDHPLVREILERGREVRPPKPPVTTATEKPPEAVPIRRVTQGGLVEAPRLVYRVEPRYPQLALMSHIEGVVNLKGVIAIDGHISELAIVNGNPLLAPAAIEAVRQWRYSATRLNGVPVEVETTIAVTFRLSR